MTARRLQADDTGATAIEYALLAALIAGVIIGSVLTMGQTLNGLFTTTNSELIVHMPAP
jgi:pilus assembly protein Flp/PilA